MEALLENEGFCGLDRVEIPGASKVPLEASSRGTLSIFTIITLSNLDFLRGFSRSVASKAACDSGLNLSLPLLK